MVKQTSDETENTENATKYKTEKNITARSELK